MFRRIEVILPGAVDDEGQSYPPSKEGLNGGSIEFPDPATGWHDPSLAPQAGHVNER